MLLFSIHAGEASNEINASLLFAFTVKITFSNLLAETLALSSNEPFMSSNLVQQKKNKRVPRHILKLITLKTKAYSSESISKIEARF